MKFIFKILLLSFSITSFAQQTVKLLDQETTYYLDQSNFLIFEDTNNSKSFEQIRGENFTTLNSLLFFDNPNSTYWVKVSFKNTSGQPGSWVFEGYNFRIDTALTFICDETICLTDTFGAAKKFEVRNFKHKNQILIIPFEIASEKTVFLKFKNYFPTGTTLVIRHTNAFSDHSYSEYFLLGCFYGFIALIAFYNLLLYFSTRAKAFLYYFLYVITTGTFFLSQDGLGFQFLWPRLPYVNQIGNMVSFCIMTLFLLLYSRSFLNYRFYYPKAYVLINYYVAFRLVVLIICIVWFPELHYLYIDFLPFIFVYITAFSIYQKGYSGSIFFISGFSILLLVFAIHAIRIAGLIAPDPILFYFPNIGILLEMIVLGVGLAVKIGDLKDQERMSEKLEMMVKDRTEELDNYLYKTSHDINGPLKTIIGLSDLGRIDTEHSARYFELIHQTGAKLDRVLHSLGEITHLNKAMLHEEEIKLDTLFLELRAHVKMQSEKNTLLHHGQDKIILKSDHQMLWMAFKNLVDFSVRRNSNQDPRKIEFISSANEFQVLIEMREDSFPIDPKDASSIFSIFKKLDFDQTTGLELYSAQKAILRIGGSIELKSDFYSNAFYITLPVRLSNLKNSSKQ
jgi:signal transduction histidine kinase